MQPIGFKETNKVYGAGDNPNTDQLPVAVCTNLALSDNQPVPFVVSCWKLTDEEIAKIKETGVIWFSTMGISVAPMLPMADNPFTEMGFKPIE